MPLALGTDSPIWAHPAFVHAFGDAFLEPQARRSLAAPLPDPAEFGLKESAKEAAARLTAKPNQCAFPLLPTIEFVCKLLNNVHGLCPKSLQEVLDNSEEAVTIRRVTTISETNREAKTAREAHTCCHSRGRCIDRALTRSWCLRVPVSAAGGGRVRRVPFVSGGLSSPVAERGGV